MSIRKWFKNKFSIILLGILALKLFFNIYGISWGLPDRWNIDEQVAKTLRMMSEKKYYSRLDLWHPTFYKLTLSIFMVPYLGYLKFSDYPLEKIREAASVSWIKMAESAPNFAKNIYITARLYSSFLGVLAVYLIYLVGKLIHNREVGIYSALIMALSAGLIGVNHFAKSTSLVLVLNIIVLYFSISCLKKKNFSKYIFLASFFAGLATATKFDGGIAVFYIIVAYSLYYKNYSGTNKKVALKFVQPGIIIGCTFLFISGLFLGWPVFFLKPLLFIDNPSANPLDPVGSNISVYNTIIKLSNGLFQVILDFNLLISLIIYGGLLYLVLNFRKYPKEILIPLLTLPVYFFITSRFLFPTSLVSMTKIIIQSYPALTIIGGFALFYLMESNFLKLGFKIIIMSIILTYSVLYSARADTVFSHRDTRYSSTHWILKNIPEGSAIEHLQDADWLFSPSKIVNKYHVIYYGRNSKKYAKSFYHPKDLNINNYIEKLNKTGSESEYFIAGMGKELEHPPLTINGSKNRSFFGKLLAGETNFRLLKKFEFKESLLWNYRPDYCAPTIYVFKKN